MTSTLSGACCMLYSFADCTLNWFFSICASFSSKPGGALLRLVIFCYKKINLIVTLIFALNVLMDFIMNIEGNLHKIRIHLH